jgi:hypothetical protein
VAGTVVPERPLPPPGRKRQPGQPELQGEIADSLRTGIAVDIDPLQRHSAGSIEDKTAENRLSKQRKQRLRQSRSKEKSGLPSQVDTHG